jgi:hypothetical protein
MKATKILAAVAVLSLATAGSALAFHDGGVAYCDGCHTMHNSQNNKAVAKKGASTQFQGLAYLLQGSDDSSTCLNCHAAADAPGKPSGYHIMTYPAPALGTAPTERTPGGDFAWLTQTYTAKGARSTITNLGERKGHNVVAADFGLVADSTLLTAPGGTYANTALSCASCHDPHARARIVDINGTIAYPKLGTAVLPIGGSGSYGGVPDANQAVGVYRILAGKNYSQMSYTNATPFTADPPVAVAPSTYNTSAAATGGVRVAYGKNMSEWCANCHVAIHNDGVNAGNTKLIHPAGNAALLTATANDLQGNAAGTTIATIYNAYKKSGDLTGAQASSFSSTVPYEAGTGVIATLSALQATTAGPSTGTENVMCLSCHRAHAGGFPSMARFAFSPEFITVAGAWPDAAGASVDYSNALPQAVYAAAMYDQTATNYAYAQRSLCNKCHAKD